MTGEAGRWMWIVMSGFGVVVLAAALFYAMSAWRKRRSPAAERPRDRKTEELHRQRDPDEDIR